MKPSLRLLFVEDSEDDTLLILDHLRRAGHEAEHRRVDRLEDLRSALVDGPWDAVICDYNLPGFGAPAALGEMRARGPDAPVIVVSGAVTEEIAVRTMKAGAHDFVSKNNLARLVPALERELREARERAARRQAEAALEKSRARTRSLMECDMFGVFVADCDGRLLDGNAAFCRMLDHPIEMVRAGTLHWDDLLPQGQKLLDAAAIREVRQCGRFPPVERDLLRRDGLLLPALMGGTRVEDASEGYVCFVLDVSRLRQTEEALQKIEEQLQQSQKMEAIGKLAGGIAHDFNNLLTAINGYSSLALDQVQPEHRLHNALSEINKAGERAAALTRQLLAYSRKQVMAPKVLNLNATISEMHNMLSRLIGEDIELRVRLQPELGMVKVDPAQLEQVVLNLVVNARDAMPRGGTLMLETRNARLDQDYVRRHPAVLEGSYVQLSVSDTGEGMDEETRQRIFEPFFTTKEPGKGSGLGLSMVDGIVSQSGGYIFVHSEAGTGTSFEIYFPVEESPEKDAGRVGTGKAESIRGNERVLLAEDEEAVRRFARRVLEDHGYAVTEARDGRQALLALQECGESPDLLLADVGMPHINGRQLAEKVLAMHAETRIIFMSGYTDDAIIRHGLLSTTAYFLQKPFSAGKLLRTVREILDLAEAPREPP